MVSALRSLAYLPQDKETFSIREWVKNKNDSGWLFIAGMPNQREPLKPLMSAWLSIAVKSLMELDENHDYRLWFVIDELASLNKIPILKQGLAEVRKYGGCFVIGFQNIHQLYAIYRQDDAQTIVSLMGTKLVFKSESAEAAYLSKVFGEQEVLEQSGSVSYGAHQMRDGVSLSDQKKTKPIISPTDIMMLSPLQAYLKFPRQLPFSKVTFPITKTEKVAEKFIGKSAQEDVSETTKIHIDLAKLEETSRVLPFPLAPERQMKKEGLDPTKESDKGMGFSL
jgi:type IV secretory pathway TraG/TraD family ATPase VirD4